MLPALLSDEESERGPRSIALRWSEDQPGRMLRIDQLGACTHPAPVLGRHPGGKVEWFLDEGEQEREVKALGLGGVVDANCYRFADNGTEE